MMFLHVVDVGDWNCRITSSDELICQEHELAKCGPAKWMQAPWFRGSGSVTARRAGERNSRPSCGVGASVIEARLLARVSAE